ncbi:hypothetical protein [Roseibium sp.]|uniref:hypothetical protein n=1 Tax=Roseibium sp. TaxID=1936156 RepID=UPI003D10A6CD
MAPAYASCSSDGSTLTCSGDVQPISIGGNTVHVVVEKLTSDMSGETSGKMYIDVESKSGVHGYDDDFKAPDRGSGSHTYGKGGSGYDALNQSTTLSLGDGFNLLSSDGGIQHQSTGANGQNGEDHSGAGAHTHRGGYGGDGGKAGTIDVTASGSLQNGKGAAISAGSDAVLYLQSFGGAGGNGGEGHSEGGFNDGYGGYGGEGGDGGAITVTLEDDTYFTSAISDGATAPAGIYIVSAGGNGGKGGEGDGRGATGGYGGYGGSGGDGGAITLTANSTNNKINASNAHGIVLTSRAGSGGDGGRGTGGGSHPGDGAGGGDGGKVTARLSGTVTTTGKEFHAVVLQSAGGASGDAGSEGRGVSHPGNPGDPGEGGDVSGTFSGFSATTDDEGAVGILAHSVGGFAPNAPASSGLSSYGASGGSGGAGGAIELTLINGSQVTTKGDYAIAVNAHSVGGGGGAGGDASGITALGGTGGAGGQAGDVSVTLTGSGLETHGVASIGLAALSVGGGGGAGGSAKGITTHGGDGGAGGNGESVTVAFDGATVTTKKDSALGVIAASIGGGGGVSHSPSGIIAHGGSGGDGGSGGKISYASKNGGLTVTTNGANADGVALISVGGGGGHGGSTHAVTLFDTHAMGGKGGDGGAGGDITLSGSGKDTISTTGNTAAGYAVVTVGGGGGRSGSSTTFNLVGAAASDQRNPGINFDLGMSKGGGGGAGNNGGTISGNLAGKVTTSGHAAPGVLLVSTGRGGGSAGNYSDTTIGLSFSHTLGASGGSGGDGGEISVTLNNDITTSGADADAIVAVSVGGGGGHSSNVVNTSVGVDLAFTTSHGASGGDAGKGGDVTLTSNGTLTTKGHQAAGILAVSSAKGGGKSGNSVIAGVDAVSISNMTAGPGGAGGTGGTVSVTNNGVINTAGGLGYGILATSVGGGGGVSGTSASGKISALNLGGDTAGDGGAGGTGGTVTVTTKTGSQITTTGDKAVGILALSVGGSGGAGGSVYSGSLSVVNGSASVGGTGGDGGTGGTATAQNQGQISTKGNAAPGIAVMSLGGHGGTGGLAVSGDLSVAPPDVPDINIGFTIGGDGGAGGNAGKASVDNTGKIDTAGFKSDGISALSVGGSGGTGGVVYSGNLDVSFSGTVNMSVDVGGSGGGGGSSGESDVTNSSSVTTSGHKSSAIYAQAIGGNGGSGSNSYLASVNAGSPEGMTATVSVGGSGGNGANGGDISVTNKGSLSTTGGDAHGIFAHSIGGNGGDGGSGIGFVGNFVLSGENYTKAEFNTRVGGSGGSSMDAGKVTVVNDGSINTQNDTSYGIFAQSVGGGGGYGGGAGSYFFGYTKKPDGGELPENKGFSLDVNLGGSGGAGGDGDDVTVTNNHSIKTSGDTSYGIFAQSVGGGGGHGGSGEPGLEGWLADVYDTVEKVSTVKEVAEEFEKIYKKEWHELFLEGFTVDVGGSEGANGSGGDVSVTNAGTLTTTGKSATAIYAQSVGGGGGSGGDGSQGLLTSITVAGKASGGGDGGTITIANSGKINTSGDGALGIFAQSVGGGGGDAGEIESSIVKEIGNLPQTLGAQAFGDADGGKGGNGGAITITSDGSITTSGAAAHGIFAHSVGGGGGSAGELTVSVGQGRIGSEGGTGSGGRVDVSVKGTVSVTGEGSHGIFAQSVAGRESLSDGVSVTVSGLVEAKGKNGRAILVQADEAGTSSSSSGGVSSVTVDAGGKVQKVGSEDDYAAIAFLSGRTTTDSSGAIAHSNLLTNHGEIYSPAFVVESDGQSGLRIQNYGTMYGRLRLGGAAQTEVTVEAGGKFYLGNSDLGTASNSLFANSGTIKPGWTDDLSTITLKSSGSFQQYKSGTILFDAQTGDNAANGKLVLDIKNVSLDGTVRQNFINNPDFASGEKGSFIDVIQYTGKGSIDKSGLSAPSGTAMAYTLNWSDENKLSIDYEVDYSGAKSGATISDNAARYGSFFNRAMQAHHGSALPTDTGQAVSNLGRRILNAASSDELQTIYEEHMLDEAGVGATRALQASYSVQNLLRSCPELDPSDPNRFYRQQECFWGKAIGGFINQDRSDTSSAYNESVAGFAVGAQREIADHVFLEAVGQYEQAWVNGTTFAKEGHQVSAGVALKREVGNLELSGTASGGIYTYDHQRTYSTTSTTHQATSDVDGRFASVEARIAGVFQAFNTYIKPSASVGVTQIWQDGFSESGEGPLNWKVGDIEHTAVYVRPMLEVGRAFDLSGAPAIAFVRAGLTHQFSDNGIAMSTELVDGGSALSGLNLVAGGDQTQLEFEAGFNAEMGERFTFSVLAATALSESRQAWGGQAKLSYRF